MIVNAVVTAAVGAIIAVIGDVVDQIVRMMRIVVAAARHDRPTVDTVFLFFLHSILYIDNV